MSRGGLQLTHTCSPEISSMWLLRFHKGEVFTSLSLSREPVSLAGIVDHFRCFLGSKPVGECACFFKHGSQRITRPHSAQTPPPRPDIRGGLSAKSPTWHCLIKQPSILHVDGNRRGREGMVPSAPYLGGKHPVTPYFTPQAHATSRKIKDLAGKGKT